MSTKSKSTLPETPKSKTSPATPRASKVSRGATKFDGDSPSQNLRSSADQSPRSAAPKPSVGRSTKLGTPPDKKPARVLRPSELQTELNLAQEDLKKAKEKLASVEKEKTQALDDLKEAKKLAEEANEKLREALIAQKRAEDDSEIEKFRTVEMEQAGIEAAQKKEEEWQKEVEAVRSQHALDVAALLSATQELQRVKQELAMTCDAKNQALAHADDATKIAEIHAGKVEILSAELIRVKSMLDSRVESESTEKNKLVEELNLEIETLRKELEMARSYEVKVMEKEAVLEQCKLDLEAAKMAASYAHNLVEEWKKRVEDLEFQTSEAQRTERSASESLESAMKELEGRNDLLHDAETEIASLKEKLGLLEFSVDRQKGELEESECHFKMAREEASKMAEKVESLSSELETVKEDKIQALNNEKLAADSVEQLLEEKNKLLDELKSSREEEEKNKKAMESLTSALHEVSSEAREAKEKLLSSQAETGNYETQIEDLQRVLKTTNERYENMLGDAKQEIDLLTNSVEQSKQDYDMLKAEQEEKERDLMNCVVKTEEANSSMEKEINRLVNSLKEAQEDASNAREDEARLKNSLKETESEVVYLKEVLGEAKAESMKLKESLMDKENEVQNILQENEELRSREAAALKKIEELSKMLEEALAKKQAEENGGLTDSEKDSEILPKSPEQNGVKDENPEMELRLYQPSIMEEFKEVNNHSSDNPEENAIGAKELDEKDKETKSEEKEESKSEEKEANDSVEAELKTSESFKFVEKDSSPEREPKQEEEPEPKAEVHENNDQSNGVSSIEKHDNGNTNTSPVKPQSLKKKKPLLSKFGSLLKKKGAVNQK
ncbi:WEB family protein At3g02930, chloroplastic-like [Ipomoea triloba]|uniref:WEB family protein At3g02930, chloroplastic-like n=1 Tax=Ipomoea triloba TaxID=35885 RepID=UPI00125D2479|nr:WEB family protein At3g02930, chloroplastic-like [Ipomoea triloba]